MKRNLKNKTLGIAAAGLACAALAGCTVGPVTLPDIDLGFLKGVGIVTTSVADATVAMLVRADSPFAKPEDLNGKTVGCQTGSAQIKAIDLLAEKLGGDIEAAIQQLACKRETKTES